MLIKCESTSKNYPKYKCEGCNKKTRIRNLILFKGKHLCRHCRNKTESYRIQSSASQVGRGKISLTKALERTYRGKLYVKKDAASYVQLSLPLCLAERDFKIILCSESVQIANNKGDLK